jgi:hypothetical protein
MKEEEKNSVSLFVPVKKWKRSAAGNILYVRNGRLRLIKIKNA